LADLGKIARRFFAVSNGITEHFTYLRDGRLRVYLVILKHTNTNPWWMGFSVRQVAREAHVSVRQTHRILEELAGPYGPGGRRYIKVWLYPGARPNKLQLLRHIRLEGQAVSDAHGGELAPYVDMGGNIEGKAATKSIEEETDPGTGVNIEESIPGAGVNIARRKLQELKDLRLPQNKRREEEGESSNSIDRGHQASDTSCTTTGRLPLGYSPEEALTRLRSLLPTKQ
jgi:hypothetical protein